MRRMSARFPTFDQIPVRDEREHVLGVLERSGDIIQASARERMRRIDDAILVSADMPLDLFVPKMEKPPFYRLVLDGVQIKGVVTRSDLLKLPVRLLVFALGSLIWSRVCGYDSPA